MATKAVTVYYKYDENTNIELGSAYISDSSNPEEKTIVEQGNGYTKYSDGTMDCTGVDQWYSGITMPFYINLPQSYIDSSYSITYTSEYASTESYDIVSRSNSVIAFYSHRGIADSDTITWYTTGKYKSDISYQ